MNYRRKISEKRIDEGTRGGDQSNRSRRFSTLAATLNYSQERNYSGYDYADGVSSRILKRLPVDNKWINILFQESAKRAPINIRPALLIPRRRNFKGTALFALANVGAYELTGRSEYLDEAVGLLDWLLDHRRESPFGWGHNHDVQMLGGKTPRNTPSIVTNCYATRAILRTASHTDAPGYELVRDRIPDFVVNDLDYTDADPGSKIKYRPTASDDKYVLNANALGARVLLDLYEEFGDRSLRERAEEILDYVAARQHSLGGWKYTDPPSGSHLSMDSHHNGFIVESFLRHKSVTGSHRYSDTLDTGLQFYKNVLFEPDGTPNWDEASSYPKDIHAVAQGVVTFTMADDIEFADKIVSWALDNLYAGSGRFYYRQERFYTRSYTLMRWCQAWMAYALSEFCLANADADER